MNPFRCRILAALLWLVSCTPLFDAASAGSADLGPIQITMRPVPLHMQDASRERVGKLIYRGGFSLTSSDARFGGWSDLEISDDGKRLTAISDRGFWFDATVEYDADGRILRLVDTRFGGLTNLAGYPQHGLVGDAEGLSGAPDGSFFVSYERRHRVWHYPAADPPFSVLPRIVPPPPEASDAPQNGGIEALVRLPGGRLFALTEGLRDKTGAIVGWVGDGRTWQRLTYRSGPDFNPTSMALLPGGNVVVLERRFTRFGMPGVRFARIPIGDIRAGAYLTGEELALIAPPLTLDNFEGIAARSGPRGETFIYVLSDDNYFFLQRTLLLMFELAQE